MTPIEIIALAFAIIAIIKMLVLLVNHKKWMVIPEQVIKFPWLFGILYLGLAALVGYYLLQVITIIQLFAAVLFAGLIIGITWVTDTEVLKRIMQPYMKMDRMTFLKKYWIELLVWLAASVYVIYLVLA